MCVLLSSALPQGAAPCTTLPPPPDYWYTFVFSGRSRSSTRKLSFSVLRSPFGHANTFSCLSLHLNPPRMYLNVLPHSPFLALAFPSLPSFLLLLPCAPNKLVYTLGFLRGPSINFRLRHPTLFRVSLSLLFPIQPYQLLLATAFLGMFLIYCEVLPFQFLSPLFIKWIHSQF